MITWLSSTGLTRLAPRIHHFREIYAKRMDRRVKPVDDRGGWASAIQSTGSRSGMALIDGNINEKRLAACRTLGGETRADRHDHSWVVPLAPRRSRGGVR